MYTHISFYTGVIGKPVHLSINPSDYIICDLYLLHMQILL